MALKKMTLKKAFAILEISYGDIERLDKQYRVLALKHHPDRGGDESKMQDLNNAKSFLKEAISKGQLKQQYKKYNFESNKNKFVNKKTVKPKSMENFNAPFAKMSKRSLREIESEILEKRVNKIKNKEMAAKEKSEIIHMHEYYKGKSSTIEKLLLLLDKKIKSSIGSFEISKKNEVEPFFYTFQNIYKFKKYPQFYLIVEILLYKFDDNIGLQLNYSNNGDEGEIFQFDCNEENIIEFKNKLKELKINFDFM